MRALFLTSSPGTYMAPPQLADEQIVAGPDWPDAQTADGRWISLRTPVGTYDLATVLAKLPTEQKPDAVVSLVDASWRNVPRNVAAFRGPKALLVADTHHMASPLISMFQYAATEAYDRVVFLYDRHHAGFFQAVGFKNLFWFPGLTFPHADETVRAARAKQRASRIAFVGQSGKLHPRRTRMLDALKARGLPLDQRSLRQEAALGFYGSSALGFNASLNGDLNLRVFETIATGAALLTDRLSPASGLVDLFAEGREIITYASAGELAERAAHALAHPVETAAIGAAGAAWFDMNFNAERRCRDFGRLLLDGMPPTGFELPPHDKTQVFFGGETNALLRTMMVYEGVQELHRTKETVRVALTPGVPSGVAAAFETLPRVEVVCGPLSTEADITVFTRDDDIVPAQIHAPRIWCCDALPEEHVTLKEFLQPAGFSAVSEDVAVLCRVEAQHPEQIIKIGFESGDAHLLLTGLRAREGNDGDVISCLQRSIRSEPNSVICWHALGLILRNAGRGADGLSALLRAILLKGASVRLQLDLAALALELGHGTIAADAAAAALAADPAAANAAELLAYAQEAVAANATLGPRDLLISHVEVNDRQGTGVLLKRLFPDAEDFITVRSRSQHGGNVDFGGIHLSMDLPVLPADVRREILRRLLAPYRVRRILAVPYFASDFEHALTAKALTGAPLCTFAMDDQAVYCRNVPRELARKLFAASDLRLAISPEMAAVYTETFKQPFHFMPPVLSTADDAIANHWTSATGPANRVAMLGNVWTAKRFEQLREFVRRTGWKVDWYGPGPNASWLRVEPQSLAEDGIFCRGFLPEDELISALASYPAVLIPSGMLDATEDNEAFSRLSLPSRMLFVLVKTQTPMLVLGSPETAAGRFLSRHGVGLCTSFDPIAAAAQLATLATPAYRKKHAEAAQRAASDYVLARGGDWIWTSLASRQPEPAPFYQSALPALLSA